MSNLAAGCTAGKTELDGFYLIWRFTPFILLDVIVLATSGAYQYVAYQMQLTLPDDRIGSHHRRSDAENLFA